DGFDAADPAAVLLVERERQVGLVVHAVQALHDGLLDLLDRLDGLAGVGIDLEDSLVVDLHLEVLRPAAVATQPARAGADGIWGGALHRPIMLIAVKAAPTGGGAGL